MRRSGASSPRASASCQGDFSDDVQFDKLRRTIEELDELRGTAGNHAFYLSIPPKFFGNVITQLQEHGLTDGGEGTWRRVVVEKPFGHDLESARELNATINEVFPPESVFRIDHYLGKETVQNILAMRFANNLFEPIWNSNYVDHVQITMAEDIGIGGRASYYDGIGAARDVIQNHLLQLLALVAMEEPLNFEAANLRAEKEKVLASVTLPRRLDLHTARGQYAAGWAGGEEVIGYLDEEDIKQSSTTETFAAIRLEVETRRWAGVPFYLRTGKRLGRRVTEVAVVFKRAPAPALRRDRHRGPHPQRDRLPDPARRGGDDPVRLQGAGQRHGDPRREHGLRLRRLVHRVQPGGLRAADPRRTARRSTAVPPERRGGAVLEDPRPDPGALGRQGRQEPGPDRPVRARQLGPGFRARDAGP